MLFFHVIKDKNKDKLMSVSIKKTIIFDNIVEMEFIKSIYNKKEFN